MSIKYEYSVAGQCFMTEIAAENYADLVKELGGWWKDGKLVQSRPMVCKEFIEPDNNHNHHDLKHLSYNPYYNKFDTNYDSRPSYNKW